MKFKKGDIVISKSWPKGKFTVIDIVGTTYVLNDGLELRYDKDFVEELYRLNTNEILKRL